MEKTKKQSANSPASSGTSSRLIPIFIELVFVIIFSIFSLVITNILLNSIINPAQPQCRPDYGMYSNTCPQESGLFPDRSINNLLIAIFVSLVLTVFATYFTCRSLKIQSVFIPMAIIVTLVYVALFILAADLRSGILWRQY